MRWINTLVTLDTMWFTCSPADCDPLPSPCLPGDRGVVGRPGEKPYIPRQVIEVMKGAKGEDGQPGEHGFTGARGV